LRFSNRDHPCDTRVLVTSRFADARATARLPGSSTD